MFRREILSARQSFLQGSILLSMLACSCGGGAGFTSQGTGQDASVSGSDGGVVVVVGANADAESPVDALAESPRANRPQERFDAEVVEVLEDAGKVLLVKPLTDLLVVCDDFNLPLGKLRARARGTHGGHNGLRDIQNHLGTTEYARLRIGVDAPGDDDTVDHVLGRFRPSEKAVIEEALQKAVQAVDVWLNEGIAVCMNQYNSPESQKKN